MAGGQRKRLAILGATGSIGTQALEVVDASPDRFEVAALTAHSNAAALADLARRYRPRLVAIVDETRLAGLRAELSGLGITAVGGTDGLLAAATLAEADLVLAAGAGVAGLAPILAAIEARKGLAIANKEPLVAAGHLVTSAARQAGVTLLPVDSEHSAIFQALGDGRRHLRRILLTASGGAFRDTPVALLDDVTPAQALSHPTWRMGPKVTIDSATLMNKGLEVIEAQWLFEVPVEQIEVVLHRQSIVHSLVEFVDGAILGQLSGPDMRLPIQYALSYPERIPVPWGGMDLVEVGQLTFEKPDLSRYPCLELAITAARVGGSMPAAMNAADEVAVAAFLAGKIRFTEIPRLVQAVMTRHQPVAAPSLEQVLTVDGECRGIAESEVAAWRRSR